MFRTATNKAALSGEFGIRNRSNMNGPLSRAGFCSLSTCTRRSRSRFSRTNFCFSSCSSSTWISSVLTYQQDITTVHFNCITLWHLIDCHIITVVVAAATATTSTTIIRPHRSRSAAAYSRQTFPRTFCRSVRASVCPVHCRKTADWIRMPFGIVGRTDPGMRKVLGFGNQSTGRGTFGGTFGTRHCNQWGLYSICVQQRRDAALFQNYLGKLVITKAVNSG